MFKLISILFIFMMLLTTKEAYSSQAVYPLFTGANMQINGFSPVVVQPQDGGLSIDYVFLVSGTVYDFRITSAVNPPGNGQTGIGQGFNQWSMAEPVGNVGPLILTMNLAPISSQFDAYSFVFFTPPDSSTFSPGVDTVTLTWNTFNAGGNSRWQFDTNFAVAAPEPSTYALLGSFLAMGALLKRRQQLIAKR